ncbi:MAG TPA: trypsin-like peptidase domain-containing protein [Saprospiraceae bacterium]|jgi:serine protease Do|nr:trypsin-like peptidase domain-containing protein [Saprospiraceae bacterium]HRO08971.1 trypsin-like peptidase domain-containing protein [Saprospiraceae bacterium]HRP42165.1 trypsin-like peptidase domain-containing protein [Saprospiraceae bacterium]
MNQNFQMLVSGIIGGLFVLAGVYLTDSNQIAKVSKDSIHQVSITDKNTPFNTQSSDFVESAKKSTGSVVYIYAEESDEQVVQRRKKSRYNDPFFDFFGFNDMFGEGNFYAPRNGSGSGVIISADGYIVTNNHVVGFADKITVTDYEGKKYNARKVGVDELTDLAVIKIDGAKGFSPVKVGDSDKVQVGEWVLAVGNPFGYLTSTVTAGIVSAKGRSLDIIPNKKRIEAFIQTDAAINPGNSGGALVNLQGELIGINTAIATPTGVFAGYSFAIPSNIVNKVIKNIIETGGNIERVDIGVAGYDVTDDLAQEFGLKLKNNQGFYIDDITKKSSAQFSGLLPGDVIMAINGTTVRDYEDINNIIKFNKVGDKLNIKINRKGKEMDIPLQLRKNI